MRDVGTGGRSGTLGSGCGRCGGGGEGGTVGPSTRSLPLVLTSTPAPPPPVCVDIFGQISALCPPIMDNLWTQKHIIPAAAGTRHTLQIYTG